MATHISADRVNEVYDRLLAQGFVPARVGRQRKQTKPLAPALAAALGISERRARQLVARRNLPPGSQRRPVSDRTRAAAKAVREQLQQALGTKVELRDDGGVGTIKIHYSGYAQLEGLMRRMGAV